MTTLGRLADDRGTRAAPVGATLRAGTQTHDLIPVTTDRPDVLKLSPSAAG